MHCQSGNFGQNSDGSPQGLRKNLQNCVRNCTTALPDILADGVLSGFGRAGGQVKSQNRDLLTRVGGQSIIGVATVD